MDLRVGLRVELQIIIHKLIGVIGFIYYTIKLIDLHHLVYLSDCSLHLHTFTFKGSVKQYNTGRLLS